MRDVCILGAGIGTEHAAAYATLPERFRVHSVCDLDPARGRALADRHGARYVPGLDAVLADGDVDIVDVCLPPHLHLEACLGALGAGKHVICEKPLVGSLAEADRLSDALGQTDRRLFPVFQYRYGIGAAQLGALIAAGVAGRCHAGALETHWDRDSAYYAPDWRGTWAGEQGGAILGHAIHIHDLAMSFLGAPVQVFADLATRVNAIEVEDCAALSIRMASGAVLTSSVTLGAAGNRSRLSLMFEGLTAISDEAPYGPAARPWTFVARAPVEQARIDRVLDGIGPVPAGYAGLFAAIGDALDGRPDGAVSFADARRSIEFVTAVYASARAGRPATLPIGPEHPMYGGWTPSVG